MVEIRGVAHFSIPVSDLARSTRFYAEVIGCRHLSTTPDGRLAFLDAGGVCLLLVKREPPIVTRLEPSDGVHHAFMVDADAYVAALDHLRAHGVDIFFEEDRQGGTINGPRAYFRDPDGTTLEYINRTSYAGGR